MRLVRYLFWRVLAWHYQRELMRHHIDNPFSPESARLSYLLRGAWAEIRDLERKPS